MSCVLVLDDDPRIARLIRLVLEAESYEVLIANRGQDALDLLADEHPGLIVLDLMMPEMDGATFFRKAREAGYSMPVLIVSAGDANNARRTLGADGALNKPFDPAVLLERVGELLPAASS